jgi:photosystem II stability/assembly factor-like uncharacterized protein
MAFALPCPAATLFGLVDTGEIFSSSDDGVTWTVLATLSVSDAVSISAAETNNELFMATASGTVYRSTDAGVNWTAVGAVSASDVSDMLIRPSGDILVVTKTGIVWRSQDDGTTFTSMGTLTASNHASLTDDGFGYVYALTSTGEVSRSMDDGATWNVVGIGPAPDAVEIRSQGPGLYILTETGIIGKSLDQGTTWTNISTISQVHMTALTMNGIDLVAASTEGLIASSAGGSAWSWQGSINQLTVVGLGNDTPIVTGAGPTNPPSFTALRLNSVWPNPARGNGGPTALSFTLPEGDRVTVEVYDVSGRLVARRPNEVFPAAGDYTVQWDMGRLMSGLYFLRMSTGAGLHAHAKLAVVR